MLQSDETENEQVEKTESKKPSPTKTDSSLDINVDELDGLVDTPKKDPGPQEKELPAVK